MPSHEQGPRVLDVAASTHTIALALSGGGIRAMCFHLGMLRFLAERQLLERISHVSTVSGGSLLIGLLLKQSNLTWPTSPEFLDTLYVQLRAKLCEHSMQWGAIRQLASPLNWRFLLSRSNLLAATLQREWGVSARLCDLPTMPEWSINGTTAETGKRFRFKQESLGDYIIGYANPGDFPLSSALAVSAALPGGFGPLTFDAMRFDWRRRPAWDSPAQSEEAVSVPFQRLRLYDGGVYDNLGLEPFFDSGRASPKGNHETILVSDAGAPLAQGFSFTALNPWRLKRIADIMSEQSRALRVRSFVNFLKKHPSRGAYIYIGTPAPDGGSIEAAGVAASYPTTLLRPSLKAFDAIAEHGYQLASNSCSEFGVDAMLRAASASAPKRQFSSESQTRANNI